jgi:hypothetical protein
MPLSTNPSIHQHQYPLVGTLTQHPPIPIFTSIIIPQCQYLPVPVSTCRNNPTSTNTNLHQYLSIPVSANTTIHQVYQSFVRSFF